MRSKAVICCVLLMIIMLTGCNVSISINNDYADIYAFVTADGSEHSRLIYEGLKDAADDYTVNMEIIQIDLVNEQEDSIKLIKKAVRKSAKAIIITPSENHQLHSLLEKAHEKGIHLIYLDAASPLDIAGTYIYSDNEIAAEEAGHMLAEAMNNKGKAVMLNISQDDPKAMDREKGFVKAMQDHPGISIINIYNCNSSKENAQKTLNDILAAYPDINGIFAACPEIVSGAAAVLDQWDNEVKVVGFDCIDESSDLIRTGRLYGYVTQNFYRIGYGAVEAAIQLGNGQTVPDRIDMGYELESVNNLSEK